MKNIFHALYHSENSGNFNGSYSGLLRYCFQKLKDIWKDADIQDVQNFKFLVDGIKDKISVMKIDKVSLMNNKANLRNDYRLWEGHQLTQ